MKLKILILAIGTVAFVSCGPSYRVTDNSTVGIDVPSSVQTSFSTQYPNAASVTWSMYNVDQTPIDWEMTGWPELTDKDYVATFNMDNNQYYAWYDANGNWIGSSYAMSDYKTLPKGVTDMIYDKYPGYTISSVNKEMRKDDKMRYQVELNDQYNKKKILIDEDGNILKEKNVNK
jgi:hypothetical protein